MEHAFVPFYIAAVLAQLSGLLDVPLTRPWAYVSSTVLLVVAFVLTLRLGQPRWLVAASPLLYVASATLLILSQREVSTGLSVVLLVPVVSVAVHGSKGLSALTTAAVLLALVVISADRHLGWLVTLRLVVLWAIVALVLSVAIHGYRDHLRAVHANLRRLAVTDPLTGLANRRGFAEGVARRRGRLPFVLLSIDVDALKEFNDAHGHEVGDALLVAVARACEGAARAGDVVARVGGDEFAVFVADATPDDGIVVARRMGEAIGTLLVKGRPARASIGMAAGNSDDDPDLVLRDADADMYRLKRRSGAPESPG